MKEPLSYLSTLNQAQLQAVEAIEGPVMVIAGPGTGKTQILASRIANILTKTDARPQDILCLTYTDAGAIAMKRRLTEFMGQEAYRVNIHTFHAFCNRVIMENPEVFGRSALKVMDDLEREELIIEMLHGLPPEHVLKTYNEDAARTRQDLKSLFSVMQKENLSSNDIQIKAANYLQQLPFNKEYTYKKNGEINERLAAPLRKALAKLQAGAVLFDTYNRIKNERGLYEYEDMQRWVVQHFSTNESLLARYQEQFLYVLVDEYQDTSGIQNHVLQLLTGHWDSPNVFVVGDDDQSIYRFQGANVENVLDFAQRYQEHLKTVVLEENYRSSQSLLNAAQALIGLNKMRLVNQVPGLSKNLIARGTHASIPDLPVLVQLPNEIHEAIWVADQIKALIQSGVKPTEIAVLYRKHAQSESLLREFRIRKLPFNTRKPLNILEDPLIGQLLEFTCYLKDELEQSHSGQHRLFHILHYGLYNIQPISVATLASFIFKNYRNWRSAFADICAAPEKAPFLNGEALAELRRLHEDIEYWLGHAADWTVPVLLEKIIAKAGFLRKAMQSEDPAFQVEVLHSFHNLVKEENALDPNLSLNKLLERIARRQTLGITVDVEQRAGTGEGVVFSSAHSSKGLEWEHVFIVGANYEEWEKAGPIKLPFRLGEVLVDLENLSDSDEEEMRRLFYVGITRAKKSLHISFRSQTLKGKSLTPSSFIQVLADSKTAVQQNAVMPPERVLHSEAEALGLAAVQTIPMPPETYLQALVEKFELSPTALQSYLDCPIRFYFNNLIRIPQAKSEYASFGSAVHDTLTHVFRIHKESGSFPEEAQLLALFRKSMAKYRDGFTEAAFQRRLQQGMDILPNYYQQRLPHFTEHAEGVQEIQLNARINGVPIKGKIDKVELNGNDAVLVDYKTGKVENGLKKLRELSVDEKSGAWDKWGDYWLQLAFYQLLAEADPNCNWTIAGLAIDFVEQNDKGESPIEYVRISPAELQLVKDKIVETDAAIRAFKFDTGCGKKDCEWCHFARYYQLTPPSEHQHPAEELNETTS
ncbi:MAG: hypothetical protein RLZZ370_1624 [Bacteroidota bacterium]